MTSARRDVLVCLATVSDTLRQHATRIRRDACVTSVLTDTDVAQTRGGSLMIDAYVDAELVGGDAFLWWLEARETKAGWAMRAELRHQDRALDQQKLVTPVVDRTVSDEELASALAVAAQDLVAAPVDLARYSGGTADK